MEKQVNLKNPDDWFYLKKEWLNYPEVKTVVLTGARGCGKTVSTHELIKEWFERGWIGLYIRNSKRDVPTARQYFSFLGDGSDNIVNLGSMGASTIVLENKETDSKRLIGYTLFLGDYEVFKSAKRHVDYVIYEEFSSFTNGSSINRVFALTELRESIRQTAPNYRFIAISNNIFKDDLFDNLLNDEEFVHWQIKKKASAQGIRNKAIRSYLEGDYLVPDIVINLSQYRCMGYVMIAQTELYVWEWEYGIPKYVLSSTGTGDRLPLNTEIIQIIRSAHYKSLKDRNKCEFVVGLVTFADAKLRA